MRLRLFRSAALAFALLVSARGPAEDAAAKFSSKDFQGSRSCAKCHPRQYLEWRGSAHAYAIDDPIFIACSRKAARTTDGAIGDHCLRCHSPIGVRSKELPQIYDPQKLPVNIREAVSCEVCHRMEPPPEGQDQLIGDANFELSPGQDFFARLHKPKETTAHGSVRSEYLGKSESCGVCHEVLLHGMRIEKAFTEWTLSEFARRDVKCQDCHMVRYSGQAATQSPFREILRRHNFPGVTLPPRGYPNRGYQEEENRFFLKTALRVSVLLKGSAQAGTEMPITVALKNSGTGHNFPSASFRQLWVELTVLDAAGNPIFLSGNLDENGDLMDHHSELRPGADKSIAVFADYFVDAAGKEVPYWFSTRVVERSLRSLEERNVPYRIPIPERLQGSTVRVKVRVLIRAFSPYGLRQMGLPDYSKEIPIWEISTFDSGPLPVTAEVPRKTEYLVPRDFAGIQEAIEALDDGDKVLVEPGIYYIRKPIDFRGKHIQVRSRMGPERTTIQWAGEIPEKDRSSVVVFYGGEGPEARLEGFTLKGGGGTLMDGFRRGGGIHIIRSSPSIVGNTITECGAAGGVGGGICIEEADPALAGNDVTLCWAEQGGGLACRWSAERTLVLQGNRFQGNVARQGGGIYVEKRSRVRIARTLLAGNLAVDAGAGVFAGDGAALCLDHVTFVFNWTESGSSALRADPAAVPAISNSIFWGNEPREIPADLSWSLADGARPGSDSVSSEFPIFVDPGGAWTAMREADRDLARRIPADLVPRTWGAPKRWVGGDYEVLPGSPAIDSGDPLFPPDPDDTRSDRGAFFREQRLKAFVRGDVDGGGKVSWGDFILLLAHLALRAPIPCLDAADVDDGGSVSVADAAALGSFLLAGKPAPEAPFPSCGLDGTFGEGLSCDVEAPPCHREVFRPEVSGTEGGR